MIKETIKMIKLQAHEGYLLTDGETYAETVYLGKNADPESWKEVTQEEYERANEIVEE